MSLTATLLFGKTVSLPRGKKRTHLMDSRRVQAGGPAHDDRHAKSRAIRAANVERVLAAVGSGAETRHAIAAPSGVGLTTVHFILNELTDHGRIIAKRGPRNLIAYRPIGADQ